MQLLYVNPTAWAHKIIWQDVKFMSGRHVYKHNINKPNGIIHVNQSEIAFDYYVNIAVFRSRQVKYDVVNCYIIFL